MENYQFKMSAKGNIQNNFRISLTFFRKETITKCNF